MFQRVKKIGLTALLMVFGACAVASAEGMTRTQLFLSSANDSQALPFFQLGESATPASGNLDYALFATELAAFLTKEVLHDSSSEYPNSPLGSRWTSSMPDQRSEFGSHCLSIVSNIGSVMPRLTPATDSLGSPSVVNYVVRAATAGLALRQIWSAFERDVRSDRTGVALEPKVSARRVGVNLTLHW
jgi:hypothetical protein